MPRNEARCAKCGAPASLTRLERCPICHKMFCGRCAVRRHGKQFCSSPCSEFFFFGNPDEES